MLPNGTAEGLVVRHAGGVKGGEVELDEPSALLLRDLQASVDLDEVPESEFTREPIRTPEALGGERRQVVDVAGSTDTEQRLQERVLQHAVVEHLLEPVQANRCAGVLVKGLVHTRNAI